MNRTRSPLSMRCIFLGDSFEPRPNIRSLGTTGSVMNIGLSINGCSRTKPQFDEKKTRLSSPEQAFSQTLKTGRPEGGMLSHKIIRD